MWYYSLLQEINYDSPRGGVSVITEKGDITTSYLLIQRARISDSGKYTCSPSSANPETINVHILNGKSRNLHRKVGASHPHYYYLKKILSTLFIFICFSQLPFYIPKCKCDTQADNIMLGLKNIWINMWWDGYAPDLRRFLQCFMYKNGKKILQNKLYNKNAVALLKH